VLQPIILNELPLVIPDFFAIMTIIQEAESEPLVGQIAVGEVIRKRMRDKIMSDGTLVGTCLAPYQFSGWNTKDPNRIRVAKMTLDNPSVLSAIKAWKLSQFTSNVHGATHYLNPETVIKISGKLPDWASTKNLVTVINRHNFYLVP